MAGVQNIVAPQGTAFTEQHARILKRYANEVVLCFDSDNAGQNATVRSLDHLLASGLAVRVAVVPAPHDPDSFIKANGGEAFRKLVEGAEGFFEFLLNRLCATNDATTDKGRLAILRGMAEALHKTGNSVLLDTYAQKTALRLGVTVDAVRREFSKVKPPKATGRESDGRDDSDEAGEAETETRDRPSHLELHLLKLLFTHEELASWVAAASGCQLAGTSARPADGGCCASPRTSRGRGTAWRNFWMDTNRHCRAASSPRPSPRNGKFPIRKRNWPT